MKDIFTVEEINLMCIYDTGNKAILIASLRESLPGISDPEMREVFESATAKLEKVSDSDFEEIGLFIADDYFEETEV
jgi:hypothetical protein